MCDCGSSPCGCKALEIPRGPRGLQGIPGPAPDFTTTVNTLPPGSSATATVTGTSPNLTLALGIPAGDPGAQGIQGVAGDDGINAFTTTTFSFNLPAVGGIVAGVTFAEVGWMEFGQIIFIQGAGYFRVNFAYPPNYTGPGGGNIQLIYAIGTPGDLISSGTTVSPGGEPGAQGIQGIQGPSASNGTQGAQGPGGVNGINGTRTFNFPGVPPVPSLVGANVGDYMIDTTNRVLYNWPAAIPNAWNFLANLGGGTSTLSGYRGTYNGAAPVTVGTGGSIAANWTDVLWDTTVQSSATATLGAGGVITLVGLQTFNIEATATLDTGAGRTQHAIRILYRTGAGWNETVGSVSYGYTTNLANDLQTLRASATFNAAAIVGFTGEIKVQVSAGTGMTPLTMLATGNSINITAVQ